MIRLVVFDIDGVITDGTVIVDVNGTEQKKINLKDVDAIFELHREGFRLAAMEKRHIAKVLQHTKGNKTEASRLLKIGLTTLYRKIEEYGI